MEPKIAVETQQLNCNLIRESNIDYQAGGKGALG
jgi:hypothetical protein